MKHFFEIRYGPVYEDLGKDFWKHDECDNHHIISHFLGHKIIIINKYISNLIGMEFLKGNHVFGKDGKSKFVKETINKGILKNYSPNKTDYR